MPITISGSTGIAGVDGSASTPAVQGTDTNTGIAFPAADTVAIGTGGTERLRIDASGNVGIGTVAPGSPLEVSGQVDFTTVVAAGFAARIRTPIGSATPGILQFTNNPVTQQWGYISAPAQNVLTFGGNSEYMRIDSSGNLLVGTTSSASTRINVVPAVGNAGITITQAAAGDWCLKQIASNNGGSFFFQYFGAGATQVGSITSNGSTTAYNTSSDYRIKENITPLSDAAARVQALKPSRFNFISYPNCTVDGFIAHEVAAVVPEAVHGEKDAVNADGSIRLQGIDHSKLVPLLTAALQEALAEIASLKARLTALEAK